MTVIIVVLFLGGCEVVQDGDYAGSSGGSSGSRVESDPGVRGTGKEVGGVRWAKQNKGGHENSE